MTEIEKQEQINYIQRKIESAMCSLWTSHVEHYDDVHRFYIRKYNKLAEEYKALTGVDKYGHFEEEMEEVEDEDNMDCD